MGSTASPWFLPYPDATEPPANGAFALYSLANRMDLHMSNWRDDDNRLRRRPAAKLTYDSTVRYRINSQALNVVYYNNVQQDTAGMTDLQKRPDRIYFPSSPRPALYAVGGTVVGLPSVLISTPDIRLNTNCRWYYSTGGVNPVGVYPYSTRDMNLSRDDTSRGETFQVSTEILAYQNMDGALDGEMWAQLEINSGLDFVVWWAELWAFWITDVGTIPVN